MAILLALACWLGGGGGCQNGDEGLQADGTDTSQVADAYDAEVAGDDTLLSDAPEPDTDGPDGPQDGQGDTAQDTETQPPDVGQDTQLDVEPVQPVLLLTVNRIPRDMNGSVPYLNNGGEEEAFHLLLPLHGFAIDLQLESPAELVDPESLLITADVDFGEMAAGANLAPLFQFDGDYGFSWLVDEAHAAAAPGFVELQATLTDVSGSLQTSDAYSFEVAELPAHLDPFVEVDVWLVDFSRDIEASELSRDAEGNYTLVSTYMPEGNGLVDFEEVLRQIGFLGANEAYNTTFMDVFRGNIREILHGIYLLDPDGSMSVDSVRIRFYFDGDPGAPDPADFGLVGFSMIAVGSDGTPEDQEGGYIGMSWLDWNNQDHEDNTDYGHGCFFTSLMRRAVEFPAINIILDQIAPGVGVPFGEGERDLDFVTGAFDPEQETDSDVKSRYALFELFMDFGSLGVASLVAHEIGHSLGLVRDGAPPRGLFGDEDNASFVTGPSTSGHIDTAGLNIMQTGKSLKFDEILGGVPHFNPLNRAYLQRRLIVNPSYQP